MRNQLAKTVKQIALGGVLAATATGAMAATQGTAGATSNGDGLATPSETSLDPREEHHPEAQFVNWLAQEAPSADQQKPLRPGSAQARLADALATQEKPLPD